MNPKNEASKIELIAKDISYIQRDIATMNANIKELSGVYATKIALEDGIKALAGDIAALKADIETRNKSDNFWKFLSPTLAAIIGSVMTFFVLSYFTNLAK